MPLFIIGHNIKADPEALDELNGLIRQKVLAKAKQIGEYPEKIGGSTTQDMFGTVFYLGDNLGEDEVFIDGYFNPRDAVTKHHYVEAVGDAVNDSEFWTESPASDISDVTRWDVYPDDSATPAKAATDEFTASP